MKSILLLPKSSSKVLRGERELGSSDVEEIPKGLIPGEWCVLFDKQAQVKYLCYVNAYADIFFKIKILIKLANDFDVKQDEKQIAEQTLKKLIAQALKERKKFPSYSEGCRLVYGINDSLPGLIVDMYQKYILVQINTAGLDRFRDLIKSELQQEFKNHQVVFFDNEEYRKSEILPVYPKEMPNDDLGVFENGLNYRIPKSVLQKIGYYYDHRENRLRLSNLLSRLAIKKEAGLDLFSYVGSWGLHLLNSGVSRVDFVDQADMSEAIKINLELNRFSERGAFVRSDVFKFLDQAFAEKKSYDIIVSDPPAFTKSEKNKAQAILGYEKLHHKAMRLIANEGVFVAASCTHYVSFEELDKTVQEAALKNQLKLQLLDLGGQGLDHPMKGLKDKSFYIKYLVYFVNRGHYE